MTISHVAVRDRKGVRRLELAGSYPTHAAAEERVHELVLQGARPGSATVVAHGLNAVEANNSGPSAALTVAQSAATSAIGAAVVVGLFGALDPTISLVGVLALAFYALSFGAVGGALIGALFFRLHTRRRREDPTREIFTAARFDVLVERAAQVSNGEYEQC